MSNKNKLQRFAELARMDHVFENQGFDDPHVLDAAGARLELRGNWHRIFGNDHPLILELACGKGEYTVALARAHPEHNYIGVDIKGARIWKGATIAGAEQLANVRFLRTRIEMIDHFFEAGEVSEIWITFPDPFLRDSKSNRRLTSEPFLQRYRRILRPGALLHLKTDDDTLFDFSLETLGRQPDFVFEERNFDCYGGKHPDPEQTLLTYYEKQHLANGRTIKYMRCRYTPV